MTNDIMSQLNMKGSCGGKIAFVDTAIYIVITSTVVIVGLLHLKVGPKGVGLKLFYPPTTIIECIGNSLSYNQIS